MLTAQARLAMHNKQPIKIVGNLYHIIDIKRVNGTSRMIATIKKWDWWKKSTNLLMLE